jgi:hypothetical protein
MLGNWADRLYLHTIGDIKAKQHEVEQALFDAQPAVEAAVHALAIKGDTKGVEQLLTDTSKGASEGSLLAFTQFLMTMIAKYKDGQRIDDFHAEVMSVLLVDAENRGWLGSLLFVCLFFFVVCLF